MKPALAKGLYRTWTAGVPIILDPSNSKQNKIGLFLDLSKLEESHCNGILIAVNEQELARLDQREAQYERISIEVNINEEEAVAYTYIIPAPKKTKEGIVLEQYISLIKKALDHHPVNFQQQFWRSTEGFPSSPIPGDYVFENPTQNQAAGRS
jgi:hypothetical protein